MKHEAGRPQTTSPSSQLLESFEGLLRSRAIPLGFVSASDAGRILDRHIFDSLRAIRCLRPGDRELIDVGAGAGLPGIPVAIAERERHVVLLEPLAKRAAFLELAVETLRLRNVEVRVARAEDLDLQADACFARALAPPIKAWDLTQHLLRPNGRLVYFAGRSWSEAIEAELRTRAVASQVCDQAEFAWQGPIVIMARTSQ